MSGHGDDAPSMSREEMAARTDKPLPKNLRLISTLLAAVGVLAFLVGAFTGDDRAWRALLFNWLFFASVSQAGVVIVAVQRITTARWSRPTVRFLEGYVAFLPVGLLLLGLIFLGSKHIFPWAVHDVAASEKRLWLAPSFLVPRDLLCDAILTVLSLWYIWTSLRLDVGLLPERGAAWARGIRAAMRKGFGDERREIHSTHSLQGKLAVFLCLAFGFFSSVLAWDLSMTLDLHFSSTLYGWWFFMGAWLGALTTWSLLTMWWRRYLELDAMIGDTTFHDLGKLCFAFTAFWGYLTFGQYLVIWYGNVGEETHWPRLRLIAPWLPFTMAIVFMMFVIPFFGLLSRAAKVYLPTFIAFAVSSTVGLWLLRYIEVYPSLYYKAAAAPFGVYEVAISLGYLGIWGLCYAAFMDAFPRLRTTLITSPYRDEVQVPVNPDTMEPLPAHEDVPLRR